MLLAPDREESDKEDNEKSEDDEGPAVPTKEDEEEPEESEDTGAGGSGAVGESLPFISVRDWSDDDDVEILTDTSRAAPPTASTGPNAGVRRRLRKAVEVPLAEEQTVEARPHGKQPVKGRPHGKQPAEVTAPKKIRTAGHWPGSNRPAPKQPAVQKHTITVSTG